MQSDIEQPDGSPEIEDLAKAGAEAVDIVEKTQDFEAPKASANVGINVGDKVVHTALYISVCRGNAREKAKTAVMEAIKVTPRSITTRPWGSTQKYGSQFEIRYIRLWTPADQK